MTTYAPDETDRRLEELADRERDGAQRRRVGPGQLRALEGLGEDAAVEGGVVGDQEAALEQLGELRQRRLGGRRGVDHPLADLREALDRSRQRGGAGDERLPAVVQLAAADEDGADLGQLTGVAAKAVGLRVEDEELGGGQRLGEEIHRTSGSRAHPTERTFACSGAGVDHSPTDGGGSLQPMQSVAERGE